MMEAEAQTQILTELLEELESDLLLALKMEGSSGMLVQYRDRIRRDIDATRVELREHLLKQRKEIS